MQDQSSLGDTGDEDQNLLPGHNRSDKVWGMPQFKEDPLMNANISNEEYLAMVRFLMKSLKRYHIS